MNEWALFSNSKELSAEYFVIFSPGYHVCTPFIALLLLNITRTYAETKSYINIQNCQYPTNYGGYRKQYWSKQIKQEPPRFGHSSLRDSYFLFEKVAARQRRWQTLQYFEYWQGRKAAWLKALSGIFKWHVDEEVFDETTGQRQRSKSWKDERRPQQKNDLLPLSINTTRSLFPSIQFD